jgi:RNA polymerase sigma-70 factor (ECF subfamily)
MVLSQKGNRYAFEALYERYKDRLLHFFYRMLNSRSDKAQDFLQDTFFNVLRNLDKFCSDKKFSSWIYTIAHNLCKNEYRRIEVRSNVQSYENLDYTALPFENCDSFIEDQIDLASFQNALKKELSKLDPEKYCTFILRFQENFSIKEISEIMDCSDGTVKSRLFYATKIITDKLKYFNPNQLEKS